MLLNSIWHHFYWQWLQFANAPLPQQTCLGLFFPILKILLRPDSWPNSSNLKFQKYFDFFPPNSNFRKFFTNSYNFSIVLTRLICFQHCPSNLPAIFITLKLSESLMTDLLKKMVKKHPEHILPLNPPYLNVTRSFLFATVRMDLVPSPLSSVVIFPIRSMQIIRRWLNSSRKEALEWA